MAVLVLFDLDNTLADRTAAFHRWAHEFLAGHGLPGDQCSTLAELDHDGFRDRTDFLTAVKMRFGLDETVETLLADYDERYPRSYRPEHAAITQVARLRAAGARVGIVTNGRPSQALKLDVTGLGAAVDGVCVSSLVGARKPDRAIFEEAARRCRADLAGGWMVGDSPEADIEGGRHAGLRTAWLRRGRDWPDRFDQPDLVTGSVTAAVDAILAG
jgi:HAD superfamily hydrolase (TIGR01549 family)